MINVKNKKKLKIIFVGSANFSFTYLNCLIKKNFSIFAIITKKYSIKSKLIIKKIIKKKINVFIINTKNELKKSLNKIKKIDANLMVIISYGILIPEKMINLFKFGCLNIHYSLLPRWSGPSPIQYSLINNEKYIGVTIIKINSKIDNGRILINKKYKILKNDTTKSLIIKLTKIGINLLFKILNKIVNKKKIIEIKQKYSKKKSKKIYKKDAKIN